MKSQHSGWMSNQSKKPAPQSHMASNTGMTLRPNGVREYSVLGGKYERQGDYLIPCLTVPAEEEQPIGIRGQRHLDYLKQYRKVTYTNLLTSGRLNTYLADIDRQAQERFERLIEGMKQCKGLCKGDCERGNYLRIGRQRGGREKFCRLCSLISTCVFDKQHEICYTNNSQ